MGSIQIFSFSTRYGLFSALICVHGTPTSVRDALALLASHVKLVGCRQILQAGCLSAAGNAAYLYKLGLQMLLC